MRPKGLMQVSVSLLLLTAALFAILSDHYQLSTMHWAYATVGTILGFWLRDERLQKQPNAIRSRKGRK